MFTESSIEANNKQQFYNQLATQLHYLITGEANAIANLSNASSLLNVYLQDINWVGFYLWSEADNELILGPFQGSQRAFAFRRAKASVDQPSRHGEPWSWKMCTRSRGISRVILRRDRKLSYRLSCRIS